MQVAVAIILILFIGLFVMMSFPIRTDNRISEDRAEGE